MRRSTTSARRRTVRRRKTAARHTDNASRLHDAIESEDGASNSKAKKQLRRAQRLEERASATTDRTWGEFQDKVEFLKQWGYLGENSEFRAGATALMNIQISEIFTTELFLNGVFDDLPPDRLFGVLAGFFRVLDGPLMRFTDLFIALPILPLLLVVTLLFRDPLTESDFVFAAKADALAE